MLFLWFARHCGTSSDWWWQPSHYSATGTTVQPPRRQTTDTAKALLWPPWTPGHYCAAAASRNHPAARNRCSDGRYVVSTAPSTVLFASCRCSWDSASRGGDGDGVAYTVTYKDYSLSATIYREGALPSPPSLLCMNQPGNSVDFGTPLTLKPIIMTLKPIKQCWFRNAFDSQTNSQLSSCGNSSAENHS